MMRRLLLAIVLVAAGLAACARVMSPPGWVPDQTAPQLLSTNPAQLAIVPGFKGAVVFKFDERISENGMNDELAVVSPDTGLPKVTKHGREIRVEPRGGWKPGQVYQVVLLPSFRDLFGNQAREPAQLVFSTGPAITSTVVAGMLTDRITGQVVSGALVQAISKDSLAYTTASDSAGFFALRYLPQGSYTVRAFVDRNHDRHPQFREPQAVITADLGAHRDTLLVTQPIALLPNDTTPARVLRADARDSLQIRATLDDYFDTSQPLSVATQLWRLPDSVAVPVRGTWAPVVYDSVQRAAHPDTSAVARAQPPVRDTTRRLPGQELVVVPAQALAPRTRYRVSINGITNINGIGGGGGSATFLTAAPPAAPKTAAADTTRGKGGAARDTTGAAPTPRAAPPRPATQDTARAPRTLVPRPVPRDTSPR
jgi:hypothetical protein